MKPKKSKVPIPKGPCEPEPPRRPPFPQPTPPSDTRGGPDPLKWLKLGATSGQKSGQKSGRKSRRKSGR